MNGRALVARNLRRLRTERGLSQERIAADADVDRAYLSELERELAAASVDVLDKLAKVMEVPVGEFLRPVGETDPVPAVLPAGRKPGRPAER